MGCDITIKVQIQKNKIWQNIKDHDFCEDRSYATFGVLANVRGASYESISLPKGLPDEIDSEDFLEGSHSFSYYTLQELLDTNVSFKDTYLHEWIVSMLELKKKHKLSSLSHVRVIFGFDS